MHCDSAHPLPNRLPSPPHAGKPSGKVAEAIDRDLGGYDKFVEAFKAAGATQFGSGWAWLSVNKQGKLEVRNGGAAGRRLPKSDAAWAEHSCVLVSGGDC